MFLVFIHFSRRNCPIAKRRLTTVAGARPDWGGGATPKMGGAIGPPCPMLATALYCTQFRFREANLKEKYLRFHLKKLGGGGQAPLAPMGATPMLVYSRNFY